MKVDDYFEELCSDVYGYYGMLRQVDPKKHTLVMLRSMGEFWTEDELDKALPPKKEDRDFLTYTDFRRLAKAKWYNPEDEDEEEKDIRRFEEAFDRVAEFYTGNKGPNKSLPTEVLYNMMTNLEDQMPPRVARHLVNSLHVYNNAVTARSLLCLLGRREKVQYIP